MLTVTPSDAGSAGSAGPAGGRVTLADFATLPKYAGHKDLLALYGGDWDSLLDDWVAGVIPWTVKHQARETLDPSVLQSLLLERLLRQQQQMTTLLADLLTEIQTAPTVEHV